MENNGTGGNGGQGSSTETGKQGTELGFDLKDLSPAGQTKSPAELEADKKAADLATKEKADKEAEEKADKEAAGKGTQGNEGQDGTKGAEDNKTPFLEFEGKEYKMNDKGEALNEDGTVFKNKEEVDALTVVEDTALIDDLVKLNGVEILGEDNKPKKYEDTEQGVLEYMKDFATHEVKKSQQELFNKFPQAKELISHLMNGGKESDFYNAKTASWENVALDENNESQLIDVISKDLKSKGFSEEEITDHINLYKDSKKLVEKGKSSLDALRKGEAKTKADRMAADKKAADDYNARVDEYWKGVEGIVNAGQLEHITIPQGDRQAFMEYIGKAVDKQGRSQAEVDAEKADDKFNLQLDYLRFKKFDLSTLIQNAAGTKNAKSLKERINKSKTDGNGGTEKPLERVKPGDVNIRLEDMK